MQIPLMDAPEATPIGPERRACTLAAMAVDLAPAITIIITGPFVGPGAHGGVGRRAAAIARPFVRVEDRALGRDVLGDQVSAGARVGMVADPQALLARLARHHTDDRGPIIGRGAMPLALIGASAWRIGGVAMGRAFFPPRSDPVHPPHTPSLS
jgi:hypothetical protein